MLAKEEKGRVCGRRARVVRRPTRTRPMRTARRASSPQMGPSRADVRPGAAYYLAGYRGSKSRSRNGVVFSQYESDTPSRPALGERKVMCGNNIKNENPTSHAEQRCVKIIVINK
uniref:SFRICE_009763 n=1 Tax=Spodoptera frugiperda TaxID=7108 RepID=A0A2H1VLS4_SPOFR